jgi:hypothetical protein
MKEFVRQGLTGLQALDWRGARLRIGEGESARCASLTHSSPNGKGPRHFGHFSANNHHPAFRLTTLSHASSPHYLALFNNFFFHLTNEPPIDHLPIQIPVSIE